MKRYGKYYSQYNGLFDAYKAVSGGANYFEREPQSRTLVVEASGEPSFPGIKYVKIFLQKLGRGADLIHLGKVENVFSDDGKGSTVISAKEDGHAIDIISTDKSVQVKIIDNTGRIENEFVTNIPAKYDNEKNTMTVINIEEL